MMMSAEEVKKYWEDFCERHDLSAEVIAKGNARIDKDPEYWADQTMQSLLESLSK
jgi:hypothetical protein